MRFELKAKPAKEGRKGRRELADSRGREREVGGDKCCYALDQNTSEDLSNLGYEHEESSSLAYRTKHHPCSGLFLGIFI